MKKSKKDLIIETATSLFFERGIQATSMDEIAEAVPVAKMTIYKYFQNKDGLVGEVLRRYVRVMHAEMSAKMELHPDPIDAMLHIMEYENLSIPQDFLKECFEQYPHFVQETLAYYKEKIAGEFEELIFKGQRTGRIRKDISPFVVMLYIQAIKEYVARPEVMEGIADLRVVGQQFRTLFMYGIVAPDTATAVSPEGP